MTLYMAVTTDRYELPIAVERSAECLAGKMGTTRNSIYSQVCRNRKGDAGRGYKNHRGRIRFVKVEVDED
ncbi:hypothetical protein K250101E9_41860 [Enterocloster aldenensis]|uniref:hypothetical protein n=1 Tax=Enterocloster aldenensis TaxID=358742 RepID=UPI0034B6714D